MSHVATELVVVPIPVSVLIFVGILRYVITQKLGAQCVGDDLAEQDSEMRLLLSGKVVLLRTLRS